MNYFTFKDFKFFEKSPTSPHALNCKICDLVYNSTSTRCKVENVNPDTGEYRIVLQGCIDWKSWNPEEHPE